MSTQNERPLTPFAANAVAIAMVLIIAPLVMGWGMSQGPYIIHRNAPNDTNIQSFASTDYEWLDVGNCSGASNLHYTTNYTSQNFTVGDNVGNNFTGVANNGWYWNGDCGWGDYELRIYDDFWYGNLEDNVSGYYIKMIDGGFPIQTFSYNTTNEPSECGGEWIFHAEFKVDGVTQFEDRGYQSANCYGFGNYYSGSNTSYIVSWVWSIDWYHEINAVEASEVGESIRNCAPNCNITVKFSNIADTDGFMHPESDFWARGPYIQEEIYRADSGYSGAQLGLSAWILFFFFGLFAVASTPLWNPFTKHIQKLGAGP